MTPGFGFCSSPDGFQDSFSRSDCSFAALLFTILETENATIRRPNIMGVHSGWGWASNLYIPYPRIRTPPVKLSHCNDRLMILPPSVHIRRHRMRHLRFPIWISCPVKRDFRPGKQIKCLPRCWVGELSRSSLRCRPRFEWPNPLAVPLPRQNPDCRAHSPIRLETAGQSLRYVAIFS